MPVPFYTEKKHSKRYEYRVHAVTTVDETLLNNLASEWYELDYSIARPDIIYLVFRRYVI